MTYDSRSQKAGHSSFTPEPCAPTTKPRALNLVFVGVGGVGRERGEGEGEEVKIRGSIVNIVSPG